MALSRRALFGFPPPQPPSSVHTVRLVPLTQGVNQDTAWPLLAPGSAQSMTNYLPLNGKLAPRSRLSSINTILIPGGAGGNGMAELTYSVFGLGAIWTSGSTLHAIVGSNGSISRASFVSTFGLGHADLEQQQAWQYTPAFSGTIASDGGYMLVAAGAPSHDTLLCLYQSIGNSGPPQYSYLTSAPKTVAVGGIDNYVIAFNIDAGDVFGNRVQWCVRGEPSNWTGEGAGFEDLLEMRGSGTAVLPMSDGRLILFTDRETWYGVRATYPAQFQFYPLDREVGGRFPRTIADTSAGMIFLGTDWHLRVLPTGGGPSRVIAPQVAEFLRGRNNTFDRAYSVYDPITRLYHLFFTGAEPGLVVNTVTGEAGFTSYNADMFPTSGLAVSGEKTQEFVGTEGILFCNSFVVWSTNSLISSDTGNSLGFEVTSTWQSPPLAADLAGDWKQLTDINVDYRATSPSTLTIRVAADGNTYEATGRSLSLASAPVAGRAQSQVYTGGAFPTIEVQSSSTGYTLHRIDVGMNIGGRRA
jgi:hypothetical protein